MTADDGLAVMRRVPGADPATLRWRLHPPTLAAIGVKRKLGFSPRTRPAFEILAKGKRLRGTRFDPFGRTELRRLERLLVDEYEQQLRKVLAAMPRPSSDDTHRLVELATLPDMVRGFEGLKMRRASEYRRRFAQLGEELSSSSVEASEA